MLQDTDRIDLTVRHRNGQVTLIVQDDGSIRDPRRRYQMFTAKLAVYTQYLVSESFPRRFGALCLEQVRVKVVSVLPPTAEMLNVRHIRPIVGNTPCCIPVVFACAGNTE